MPIVNGSESHKPSGYIFLGRSNVLHFLHSIFIRVNSQRAHPSLPKRNSQKGSVFGSAFGVNILVYSKKKSFLLGMRVFRKSKQFHGIVLVGKR